MPPAQNVAARNSHILSLDKNAGADQLNASKITGLFSRIASVNTFYKGWTMYKTWLTGFD